MNNPAETSGIPPATDGGGRIVFECQACGRNLQVQSEAAGRSAKCPYCGSVQPVPAWSEKPPATPQTSPPSTGHGSGPFGPAAIGNGSPPPTAPSSAAPPPIASGPDEPAGAVAGQPTSEPQRLAPAATTPDPQNFKPIVGQDTPTRRLFDRITEEIGKVYVGQDELVLGTLVALFSNGHVLIESVPGLGKTLFVRTLGRVLGCQFGRIQFTADLMPSDITGAPVFDMKANEFRFRPGPVFTQLLLADEINRSPAKTHAALLEIMQEFRVTVDGTSHTIERPFLVLATQNPIESEGTYPLPEA
ncbi:MAG: AAA family ATPase, partial [Planctomycetales bacterium]|nr:AAA family ATPase [Planctomycetales bacterium]